MNIYQRIKELRLEKNLDQIQFGEQIGMTQSQVSHLESGGKKALTPDLIIKLCYALNTSYDYLIEGKGAKQVYSEEDINEIIADEKALREKLSKEELAKLVKDRDHRIKDATTRIEELLEQLRKG